MAFTYYLPDENNQKKEQTTERNSVIIIGANGSGKSKLGAWIEEQNYSGVHRIGAQRSLNFSKNIQLKTYNQAEDLVFYGYEAEGSYKTQKGARWGWGNDVQLTTKLLDDFENFVSNSFIKTIMWMLTSITVN